MEFFKSLTNCLDNNKSVVIPLGLRGHQNAITINKNTMEIARYEPHGGDTRSKKVSSSRIDKMVKTMFNTYTYKGKKFEVLGAEESCPAVGGAFLKKEFRGLQSYSNKREGGAVQYGDPGGFCCVWSLFIMDLSLRYPKEKMEDIRKRAQQLLGAWKRPRSEKVPEVRSWIRGYTKYIQDSAKDILKTGIQVVFPRYLDADDIEKVKEYFDKSTMDIKTDGKLKGEEMTKLLRMMKGKNKGVAQMVEMTLLVSYFIHIVKEMMKFKGQTIKEPAKKEPAKKILLPYMIKNKKVLDKIEKVKKGVTPKILLEYNKLPPPTDDSLLKDSKTYGSEVGKKVSNFILKEGKNILDTAKKVGKETKDFKFFKVILRQYLSLHGAKYGRGSLGNTGALTSHFYDADNRKMIKLEKEFNSARNMFKKKK